MIRLAGTYAVALVALVVPTSVLPCTTFLTHQKGPVVGNSYDWDHSAALVMVNKRGVRKTALLLDGSAPARWTSRYGSLTFNQYGRELPNGGMNERGLVVEVMWLDQTAYPRPDDRPAVSELQWVQYALDNFATVEALAAAAPTLRVAPVYAKLHYLACDTTSACAAFEYLAEGRLVVTAGEEMIAPTLTNSTYAESAAYLSRFAPFGGAVAELPTSTSSLDRFVRASAKARGDHSAEPVPDFAFGVLDSVAQGTFTKWQIVYRPAAGEVFFRTTAVASVKRVNLAAFDLSCASGDARVLNMATDSTGDVAGRFDAFTSEANEALLNAVMPSIESGLPAGAKAAVVGYPAQLTCVAETRRIFRPANGQ